MQACETEAYIQVFNDYLLYSSHYAKKYKGQHDVYPQEAEHFILNLCSC